MGLALSVVGFALTLGGCATSSSETPWPVEPDFERLRAEAKGHPRMAHAGTEWTPREPEGDEAAEPREEPEPASTWGGRRKVVAEPLPLRAGTPPELEDPDADADEDEDEPPPSAKPAPTAKPTPKAPPEPKAPPSGLGDTDDIDNDPFFKDDPGE